MLTQPNIFEAQQKSTYMSACLFFPSSDLTLELEVVPLRRRLCRVCLNFSHIEHFFDEVPAQFMHVRYAYRWSARFRAFLHRLLSECVLLFALCCLPHFYTPNIRLPSVRTCITAVARTLHTVHSSVLDSHDTSPKAD